MINALTVVRTIWRSSATAVHLHLNCSYLRLYSKVVTVHTIKVYRGSGNIAPLTLNLALDRGEWSASHPNLKIKYIHCKLNLQLTLTYDRLVFTQKVSSSKQHNRFTTDKVIDIKELWNKPGGPVTVGTMG